MNMHQKSAWSLVISILLAVVLGIAAFVIHRRFGVGPPILLVGLACSPLGVGAFLSIRFQRDRKKVVFDERDKAIEKNAHLAGFGAVHFYVILVSMVPVAIASKASIPTTWFPGLLIGAGFFQVFAQSLATLIQYGWRGKKEMSHE